jgi:hypothetical protein
MLKMQIVDGDKVVGTEVLEQVTFKSGSRGYRTVARMEIGEKKHSLTVYLVEKGSKPKDAAA